MDGVGGYVNGEVRKRTPVDEGGGHGYASRAGRHPGGELTKSLNAEKATQFPDTPYLPKK